MTDVDLEILRRLDTLIRLVATGISGERPQIQKIRILAGAGLTPKEIAAILGTTPNTVSVALSAMKLKKKTTVKRTKKTSSPATPAGMPPPEG